MEAKPLKFKSLEGLSEKQLAEHHTLYAGYVKKIGEIRERLKAARLDEANATYSELRELKIEETFALNGVKLHERYFECLGGNGAPSGRILEMIERDFSSSDAWRNEFTALGLTARGWVVLAYDLEEGRLRNFVCDLHNQGGVWSCIALLIMDVYEHAYFIDYATARKKYIEAYMRNIDWSAANAAIERFGV